MNKASAKITLTVFFIGTFNFLDIFELCRGYGLSMAFMVAGLAYVQDYFSTKQFKYLILFSVFCQLALAANLILVVLLTILLFFIAFFQIRQNLFLQYKNLVLLFVNTGLLLFWLKFSFFYKEKGILDSGVGENYWEVSFKSLMLFIYGTNYLWIQITTVLLFSICVLLSLYYFFQPKFSFDKIFEPRFFYIILLCVFIVSFYLQKKLLHVNYPEDRTGLFFYVFFGLAISFFMDYVPDFFSKLFAGVFSAYSIIYFFIAFNLNSFMHYFYHVMPKEIYAYLESEYAKNPHLFTVGGHTNREMNYTFANYRGASLLNPMDEPKQMHMNCDYYYALKYEKPYYSFFYDEVAYDNRWDRVLLKRKEKIKRTALNNLSAGSQNHKTNNEFTEFLRFSDTSLATRNCIEADLELTFKNVPAPFKAFVVFQVVDENNNNTYYKRIPLNWIADDLNGITKRFKLTSGPLPEKFSSIVVYLWNIDKKDVEFSLNDLTIFELNAKGINFVIPEEYYKMSDKLTTKVLL